MRLFEGCRFVIDLDGCGFSKPGVYTFEDRLRRDIESLGGEVLEALGPSCTHAVVRHVQQGLVRRAPPGVAVVAAEYVTASTEPGRTARPDPRDFPPYPAGAIPGMARCEISLTSIRGPDRDMARYRIQCTGAIFTGDFFPQRTTHLVVQLPLQPTPKTASALRSGVHIVTLDWVNACLLSWQREDDAPYRVGGDGAPFQPQQQQQQQQQQVLKQEQGPQPQSKQQPPGQTPSRRASTAAAGKGRQCIPTAGGQTPGQPTAESKQPSPQQQPGSSARPAATALVQGHATKAKDLEAAAADETANAPQAEETAAEVAAAGGTGVEQEQPAEAEEDGAGGTQPPDNWEETAAAADEEQPAAGLVAQPLVDKAGPEAEEEEGEEEGQEEEEDEEGEEGALEGVEEEAAAEEEPSGAEECGTEPAEEDEVGEDGQTEEPADKEAAAEDEAAGAAGEEAAVMEGEEAGREDPPGALRERLNKQQEQQEVGAGAKTARQSVGGGRRRSSAAGAAAGPENAPAPRSARRTPGRRSRGSAAAAGSPVAAADAPAAAPRASAGSGQQQGSAGSGPSGPCFADILAGWTHVGDLVAALGPSSSEDPSAGLRAGAALARPTPVWEGRRRLAATGRWRRPGAVEQQQEEVQQQQEAEEEQRQEEEEQGQEEHEEQQGEEHEQAEEEQQLEEEAVEEQPLQSRKQQQQQQPQQNKGAAAAVKQVQPAPIRGAKAPAPVPAWQHQPLKRVRRGKPAEATADAGPAAAAAAEPAAGPSSKPAVAKPAAATAPSALQDTGRRRRSSIKRVSFECGDGVGEVPGTDNVAEQQQQQQQDVEDGAGKRRQAAGSNGKQVQAQQTVTPAKRQRRGSNGGVAAAAAGHVAAACEQRPGPSPAEAARQRKGRQPTPPEPRAGGSVQTKGSARAKRQHRDEKEEEQQQQEEEEEQQQPSKSSGKRQKLLPPKPSQAAAPAAAAPTPPRAPKPAAAAAPVAAPAVPSEVVVALGGLHTDERQHIASAFRKLKGAQCFAFGNKHEEGTTHLVMPELVRSDKSMASMASGAWLLSVEWVADCARAGRLLPEEPYELQEAVTKAGAVSVGAPRHWRLRRATTGAGAFAGLRVVLYGTFDAPSADTLERMVISGGGEVLRRGPPYEGAALEAHVAIIAPRKGPSDKWVKAFQSAGMLCAPAAYLVQWIAHPWTSMGAEHRLFGTAPSKQLAALEAARKVGGADADGGAAGEARSVSF